MKKVIVGVLLGLVCFVTTSVPSRAQSAPSSKEVNEFSYDDAQLLLHVAAAEAGNQGTEGMWLVMSVVLNRTRSDAFPDCIYDVIYQSLETKTGKTVYQFSTVANGTIDTAEISPECHLALAKIECGEVAEDIVAFETKDSNCLEKWFNPALTYKDHQFYTLKPTEKTMR